MRGNAHWDAGLGGSGDFCETRRGVSAARLPSIDASDAVLAAAGSGQGIRNQKMRFTPLSGGHK